MPQALGADTHHVVEEPPATPASSELGVCGKFCNKPGVIGATEGDEPCTTLMTRAITTALDPPLPPLEQLFFHQQLTLLASAMTGVKIRKTTKKLTKIIRNCGGAYTKYIAI